MYSKPFFCVVGFMQTYSNFSRDLCVCSGVWDTSWIILHLWVVEGFIGKEGPFYVCLSSYNILATHFGWVFVILAYKV